MSPEPRKRPDVLPANVYRVMTGCGKAYITVAHDEQGLFEVFFNLGKAGQCGAAQTEGIARMVSTSLRAGVSPEVVVKQLKGIRCPSPVAFPKEKACWSCADAVAVAIAKEIGKEVKSDGEDTGNEH